MRVLGIKAIHHDPAAAFVVDGENGAAAGRERLSRHGRRPVPFAAWELPEKSAFWCLAGGGMTAGDVDVMTYFSDPAPARSVAGDAGRGRIDAERADWLGPYFVRRPPS